jgi:hypothetical protein
VRWAILPCLLALVACVSPDDHPTGAVNAAASDDALDFDAYLALAARHNVQPRPGHMLAIGLRGRDTGGNLHPTSVGHAFDDTLVLLTPDHRAIQLAVSTHPWETRGDVPDVNGDHVGDVGMIRPGVYLATRRPDSRNIAGSPTFHITLPNGDERLPGDRNTDHDTTYSSAEHDASTARHDHLTAVLFHQAGAGAPPLVGCQGLEKEGIGVVAQEGGDSFDYLLVDANAEEIPTP